MLKHLRSENNSGFTLVEVMVAVAVISIALPALLLNVMEQADGTAYIRDKTMAQWVATNKMTEVRLINRAKGEVPKKKVQGVEVMGGRDWYWTLRSKEFPQEEMRGVWGVEIIVSDNEEDKDASLVTLVGVFQETKTAMAAPRL
jgi:general secretion pathway protein I